MSSDIHFTQDNVDKIAEQARIERRMKENTLQLKARQIIQSDEQTKINKYSEGFCYSCARTDQVLTSIFHVCANCTRKRGKKGLLGPLVRKYVMELCDFCNTWRTDTSQINCALCRKCMRKVHEVHRKYRKGGGQLGQNPYYKMLRAKHGKDFLLDVLPHRRRI